MTKTPAARTAKTASKAPVASTPNRNTMPSREVVNLETALRFAPTDDVSSKICTVFGFDPVPVAAIREMVEEHLVTQSRVMPLTEKNADMHFQRIVGQYVGSAVSAARFYDTKRHAAREMNSQFNELRDEDRDGPSGFETKLERAQMFAAEMAWQSLATLAAAEGAVSAYSHITGNEWKPYVGTTPDSRTVSAQSAAVRASAFE